VDFREKVIEVAVGVGTQIAQIWKDFERANLGVGFSGVWVFRALVGCRHTVHRFGRILKGRIWAFWALGFRVCGFFRALAGCRHTDCTDLEGF
jgi:hypothetical protein